MKLDIKQLGLAMRIIPAKPLSVKQFWSFTAKNPDLRMEREPNGDVIVMRPTTLLTGYRNARISGDLCDWTQRDGRGYGFDSSTGYTLADGSVRSPDGSWISAERWNPDAEDAFDAVLCPEFVIELRSKSDRLREAQEKMQSWIANGVQLGWLIDPQRRVVEIYRRGEAQARTLEAPDVVEGEGPVAGFVLKLESIWGKG